AAGIPLTHRGLASAVAFVTAQGADGAPPDWAALARPGLTLAVYMGGSRVADIAAALVAHGRAPATPVAVISAATTAAQQVLTGTLADIAARHTGRERFAATLMIVGESVALAGRLQGAEAPQAGTEFQRRQP
ncbi:MAG: hypothetical protein IT486_11415, partial [Gammaproteobacteria bacterium]|nr:hypothetical protein [Gammaproteobacteria bacterium]